MTIHQFGSTYTFANIPRGVGAGKVTGASIMDPHISVYPVGAMQSSHVEGGRTSNNWEAGRVESADVEEFLQPGFRYLDDGMKNYWSDIRVPTRDSYRFIRTKIAGASKSLQIWHDELNRGRVQLPVISISRTGSRYNPNKFSPPYMPLRKRFVNKQRTRVALIYRPVPHFVDYTLSIWAEHKRDAEFTLYQILLRFNPLAEIRVSDDHTIGNVQMAFDSYSDNSDKEATAEQHAKVMYEVTYTAEAWLSLPEKVVPTILGPVATAKEAVSGAILLGPQRGQV